MRQMHAVHIAIVLLSASALPLCAQRVHAGITAGYMAYGTYFEGPGEIRFSNRDGAALGVSANWSIRPILSIAVAASFARSDWTFREVPIAGDVDIGGARLWFADAGLRLFPFATGSSMPQRNRGTFPRQVQPFVQAGGGLVRYSVNNSILDEHATNVALTLAGGLTVALGRLRGEVLVKDWISSFAGLSLGW